MSSVWYGFFAPSGVPDPVKKILVSAIEKSIKSADVVNAIQKLGALEDYKTSEEFKKAMLEEYTMGKELLKGGTHSKPR
jgi:tripartite-type tricarboxylate transporter receptor subunit TctC